MPNPPPYDIISEPMVSVYSTIGSEEQQRIADFFKLSGFTEKYSGFDWFLRIESLKNSLQRLLPIRRFIGGGSKTVGSGFKSLCPCQNHRTIFVRWFYFFLGNFPCSRSQKFSSSRFAYLSFRVFPYFFPYPPEFVSLMDS